LKKKEIITTKEVQVDNQVNIPNETKEEKNEEIKSTVEIQVEQQEIIPIIQNIEKIVEEVIIPSEKKKKK